ncbi:hypothetical protein KIPE111705_46645 [Kibdelosporangium persicum]|uniref:hypothetical protein n=1 Tax=Kibdelosporangium persicum TaxID=2698649 RepID=UPI001566AE06|nr:hypothetical protein [Kibdelosporangium persicum]
MRLASFVSTGHAPRSIFAGHDRSSRRENTLRRLRERHKLALTGTSSSNGRPMAKTADDHCTTFTGRIATDRYVSR